MGWLLAILAGGFLTFNAVVTPDKAASEAEKALKKQFPGAEIQVKIEGKRGKDVLNGRFRKSRHRNGESLAPRNADSNGHFAKTCADYSHVACADCSSCSRTRWRDSSRRAASRKCAAI